MAGALTPKQRAIVEATDKALDEFGKQIVAVWFQSGTDRSATMAGALNEDGLKWLREPQEYEFRSPTMVFRCFPVQSQSGLGSVQPGDPWYGYKYTDEHIPTEKLGVPTAPVQTQRCECGSGSNEASGAHSHWCPRWVSK